MAPRKSGMRKSMKKQQQKKQRQQKKQQRKSLKKGGNQRKTLKKVMRGGAVETGMVVKLKSAHDDLEVNKLYIVTDMAAAAAVEGEGAEAKATLKVFDKTKGDGIGDGNETADVPISKLEVVSKQVKVIVSSVGDGSYTAKVEQGDQDATFASIKASATE